MALKIKVKASSINNLSDARYCAGMGVEMMGFQIDSEAPEALSPDLFNAITGWISGIELIGETSLSNLPDTGVYEVSGLQVSDPSLLPLVHGEQLDAILKMDLSIISNEEAGILMEKYKDHVDFFLIEKNDTNSLSDPDLATIREWAARYPVMLGFGINADNLDTILDIGVQAISIYGSQEERPGFKDYDEMADILEALEE